MIKWLMEGPVARLVARRAVIAALAFLTGAAVDAGLLGGELGEQLLRVLSAS